MVCLTCSPLPCMPVIWVLNKEYFKELNFHFYIHTQVYKTMSMTSATTNLYKPLFFPPFTLGKWNSTSKIPTWDTKWTLFSERFNSHVWWFRVHMYSYRHRKPLAFITYLIKGRVTARIVLINHDGWTIINDFKFFRNLSKKKKSFLEKQKSPQKIKKDHIQ